jgi:recombination protein RecA
MDENRKKALAAALTQIERQFGKGSVMRMGDVGAVRNVEVISTGSLGLDVALGVGGVPKGRVVEIYGPESSGKTTLTLHIVAEAQRQGGTAAFVDAEHALDPVYSEKLGVNMDELLVSQPDTGEQALEITDMLVRSGAVDVVVVDSVAALTPKAEIEGEMGDSHVGLQARLMSQALRKLTANIKRSNSVVIFINQIRMKIGVMFGNPETTTGGNALKFYASVRLDIRRTGAIKKGEEVIGNETKVKVVKNKVAPPFRQATFDILYGEGISREGEIIDLGVQAGVVEKSGAWYSYGGNRIGQGKDNVRNFLRENKGLALEIEQKIPDPGAGPGNRGRGPAAACVPRPQPHGAGAQAGRSGPWRGCGPNRRRSLVAPRPAERGASRRGLRGGTAQQGLRAAAGTSRASSQRAFGRLDRSPSQPQR